MNIKITYFSIGINKGKGNGVMRLAIVYLNVQIFLLAHLIISTKMSVGPFTHNC